LGTRTKTKRKQKQKQQQKENNNKNKNRCKFPIKRLLSTSNKEGSILRDLA
jgi:hypothetical protein